jgi:ubiquinone/menaquinone biosynthesis C-methylase UbiE
VSEDKIGSDKETDELVQQAAGLYTHINDRMDAEGQMQGAVHYHLGFDYATEALADKLQSLGVDSSWQLLDICCGWGVPTRYLASRFGCKILAIDITQRSIDFARKITAGQEVEHLISFNQGDALNLKIESGELDLVWSQDGFCHIPDRQRLLAECFRILKPGGHLVFSDWMRGEYITDQEFSSYCQAWSFPVIETAESYTTQLRKAGFAIMSQEEVGREYAAAGEKVFMDQGLPSFIQRTALQDSQSIIDSIAEYGLESHLNKLEREKMDIYFAQGKMALGRFVCAKQ